MLLHTLHHIVLAIKLDNKGGTELLYIHLCHMYYTYMRSCAIEIYICKCMATNYTAAKFFNNKWFSETWFKNIIWAYAVIEN